MAKASKSELSSSEKDDKGRSEAFYAVQKDSSGGLLNDCLDEGVDPNIVDIRGDTALHWATWNKRPECACILLSRGADPNLQNHKGHTPLHHVVNRTDAEEEIGRLLDAFLASGSDARLPDNQGKTVYHHIAERSGALGFDKTSLLASKITDGCGPDGWFVEDHNGQTPLNLAENNGDARLSGFIAALNGLLLDRATVQAAAPGKMRRI
jgi:ankyrin repeat protein